MTVNPTALQIEACSHCQLRCPLCPTTRGEGAAIIGSGMLKLEDFKRVIDRNPQIRSVELANSGEVFLNKDLAAILEYAYSRNVTTTIAQGANLNYASDEALEALVKYQTAVVRCAIDGVTQETYSQYRVRGDLKKVLNNIQKINRFKKQYHSDKPKLILQFIVFGHNEHEIEQAIVLARMLNMEISLRLNTTPDVMPVQDRARVRHFIGYADRPEHLEKEHKHYAREQCFDMWLKPQINWDGKLLGCRRNIWGTYADNVFESDLVSKLNGDKISYAREMLMGQAPAREDIPCLHCSIYQSMVRYENWITEQELEENAQ